LKNAKKNLVFHFGGGRHASLPQKPVVKGKGFASISIKSWQDSGLTGLTNSGAPE